MDDWELIDDSSISIGHTISYLDGIETDSNGIIKSDYFSLNYSSHTTNYDDQTSVESDNPSWIDPVVSNVSNKPITETWTTDGSTSSASCGSVSDDASDVVLFDANESSIVGNEDKEVSFSHVGESEKETENRVALWCKLPLDLLKYCLFKASPVWSLSIAAAMMGVVILGRRLYKMKQKTRTLQLTLDDKKVSQVMSRAARLNEAFTVVKRTPIIRPALPGAGGGIAPWPMMALR